MLLDQWAKTAFAERAIETIAGKLLKYMFHVQTRKYLDQLPNVTLSYNYTVHSVLKEKPVLVTVKY